MFYTGPIIFGVLFVHFATVAFKMKRKKILVVCLSSYIFTPLICACLVSRLEVSRKFKKNVIFFIACLVSRLKNSQLPWENVYVKSYQHLFSKFLKFIIFFIACLVSRLKNSQLPW